MAVQTSYPGVYIDEFAPGAPIEGVGTSTAAFIGPCATGDLNEPTKITSWDQFRQQFGEQPLPGFFLWYAVRGFFENRGQVCYIVRASNGTYGRMDLDDRATPTANTVLRVRARQPGAQAISIAVSERHAVPNTARLYQPTAQLAAAPAGRDLRLAADGPTPADVIAARFRPGDFITLSGGTDRVQVVRVSGDTLRLGADLTGGPYAAGATVRLADAPAGSRTFRILPAAPLPEGALVPGTMLSITQGATSTTQVVESVQTEHLLGGVTTLRVTFRQGTNAPIGLAPPPGGTAGVVQSEEFAITVQLGAGSTIYDNLSLDPAHPRFFERIVNGDPAGLVRLEMRQPPAPVAAPTNLPRNMALTALTTPGTNENLGALTSAHYVAALDTLRRIDDVNLVACPDAAATLNAANAATVQQAIITHCEQLADRFAVLDARPAIDLFGAGSVDEQRNSVDSSRGYAALYYPWLQVPRVITGDAIVVPPSGHVCGIIARSDATRGVHKAPANELVSGALGVERSMSDIDQGQLNLRGINVLRVFSTGGRVTLWGARTTATDRNWQYVNIRRLFLYLEESIEEGIRWAVFEPNNLGLWQKLRRTITEFLTRAWRDGALFGAKPEEAFYVRIDEVLNPFSEQALGRLHLEIGVRPTYPAEFIIVRIGIWQGGKEVTEG